MSLILGICVVLSGGAETAAAAATGSAVPSWVDSQSPNSVPPVRRFYIPTDRIEELTGRYPQLRSLARDEFESLLRRARQATESEAPLLDVAEFHATLDGNRLRGGATLRIPIRRDLSSLI